MKTDKNTAEYLIKLLEEHGVDYVFGYPGEQILPIYEALRKSKNNDEESIISVNKRTNNNNNPLLFEYTSENIQK